MITVLARDAGAAQNNSTPLLPVSISVGWVHSSPLLEMSSSASFRDLPARAKVILPPWELRADKEEVTYNLRSCRGVLQNCAHDVSTSRFEVHLS